MYTIITIFGTSLGKPENVVQLGTSFELLGITFAHMMDNMDCNYDKCLKSMRDKLNLWRFRHMTIFSKITVIKTLFAKIHPHMNFRNCKRVGIFSNAEQQPCS